MAGTTPLPQLGSDVFLTDGGIETDLICNRGVELPDFASFVLHDDPAAEAVVRDYFLAYLQIAATEGFGLVRETLTWRASSDWGPPLGYDDARLRTTERAGRRVPPICDREASRRWW
jgi:S-methylmethionine-dependent homocysteine/selenocysteine methylase